MNLPKQLIILTSIALTVSGLYFSVGSYIGYSRSIDVCLNYRCTTNPTFPLNAIILGGLMILIGSAIFIIRKKIDSSIAYKSNLKIALSFILIVVISWLHLKLTQPCQNFVGRRCDYDVGFPVPFWPVSDFIDLFTVAGFLIGIILNLAIWYLVLSVILFSINKIRSYDNIRSTNNHKSLSKILSAVLFVAFPLVGFFLGMKYQEAITPVEESVPIIQPIKTPTPTPAETVSWRTYRNDEYGFEFEYPASYQETILETQSPILKGITSFEMVEGKGLDVVLDVNTFSLDYLKTYYAPTGNESFNPEQKVFGKNTFYYYGPGGGGVCYADQYFLNLTNKILHFRFHGCENDKTPSDEMKFIEQQILSTFRFVDSDKDSSSNITIETDKNSYQLGEQITFTISNDSKNPIYYTYGCSWTRPYSVAELIELQTAIIEAVPGPFELLPKQQQTCVWDQQAWQNPEQTGIARFQSYRQALPVPIGQYQLLLDYYFNESDVYNHEEATTIYSEKFTILK